MRSCRLFAIVVFGALAGVPSASAQISIFATQSQATFTSSLNASPAPYTEVFSLTPALPGPDTVSFPVPPATANFSYNITAVAGTYSSGTLFGAANDLTAVTISATGGNFNALGGNFFHTDEVDNFLNSPVTITATNALGQSNSLTYTPTSISQFLSIYSPSSPLTTVVMTASVANEFNTMDNVVVGFVPVPEPTLLFAGVAGLALCVGRVRRRFVPVLAA